MEDTQSDDSDSYFARPSYPFGSLRRMIGTNYDLPNDNLEDDDEDTYDFIRTPTDNGQFVGARAKRLGYSYFPFRYSRQFMLQQARPKPFSQLLQEAESIPLSDEYPPVKRRLAFTALRGR